MWTCTSGFEWFAPSCRPPRSPSRDTSKCASASVVASTWSTSGVEITSLAAFDLVAIAVVARLCVVGAFLRAIGAFRAARTTRPTTTFAALLALTLGFPALASFAVGVLARAFTRFVVSTFFLARELRAVALAVGALARTFAVLALLAPDFFLTLAFFAPVFEALVFVLACMDALRRVRRCTQRAQPTILRTCPTGSG